MRKLHSKFMPAMFACLGLVIGCSIVRAADADPRADAIAKTAAAFVDAFHAGDAKAVAAFWTADGDYVDIAGRVLKGRKAIEADFADLFKQNKGLKLRIDIAHLSFPTADTAIEDGTSAVLNSDGTPPNRARYTNFFVLKDGKWLLSSVREAPYTPPNNLDKLSGLDWLIGEWADQSTDGQVAHVLFDWTPDQNFIVGFRSVAVKGTMLDNGTQRIGWDPAAKQVHSWNFECDGGFSEGIWSKDGDSKWIIKSTAVLQSGHKATSTTTITRVDADTVTYQTKEQLVDGKPIADSPVITMKRVAGN